MIGLGLRLCLAGREAVTRLILIAAAVALGTGLLLVTVSGINAVRTQNARYSWLETGAQATIVHAKADPVWWLLTADLFHGQLIGRVDVAATGPTSPVPPGIAHLPGPGQYYASPALAKLLAGTPRAQLGARYPGRLIGTIGPAALPAPDSLLIVVGHSPAQLAGVPGAVRATGIATVSPSSCTGPDQCVGVGVNANGVDLILSVVAVALLFPVLIFIATATRLSAATREQRFAGMRLAGATPRQISVIAAVESTAATAAGTAAGFGLFFLLREPVAAIPFTGAPFFPADLSLSLLDVLLVAIGIPAAAAVVARFALRQVLVSPLGVSRRVTPKPPGAWRIIPLLLGLADLYYYYGRRPPTTPGQIRAYLPGFVLIMAGLIVAGPWLTMLGARIMARLTRRPATLMAARRLADNPQAGFRAVSGLVLALFVTTVAVAVIGAVNARPGASVTGPAVGSTLVDQFTRDQAGALSPGQAESPDAVMTKLTAIKGVAGAALIRAAPPGIVINPAQVGNAWQVGLGPRPGRTPSARQRIFMFQGSFQASVVSCSQLARVPALGSCPAGAQAAAVPIGGIITGTMQGVIWPPASISAQRLGSLPIQSVAVATNGSARVIEEARSSLETAYPYVSQAATLTETRAENDSLVNEYQQLADVVILVSLCIAGCTLAASVAAGLTDRKRPFSLLRLTGAPLGLLRRVVSLETAVPLLVAAGLSVAAGFLASALFARSQLGDGLVPPGAGYWVITGAGLVASLGIIAATFPLLRRMTGAEVTRND